MMIAMALAGRPEVLIADEPTTALDVTTQAQVLEQIVKLQDEFHMAVILITHYYAHALPIDPGQPVGRQLALFIVTGYAFKFLVAALDTLPFYVGVHYLSRYLKLDPRREHTGDEVDEPE